jgi:Phage tail tube protein
MAEIERGGIASFYVDGAYYQVAADIEVKPGGIVRTAVAASDSTAGYTTKWVVPEVTLDALDGPAVSITALKSITNSTVQLQLNNGKSWYLYGAFQTDDITAKIADGKATGVKLGGSRCVENLKTS